MKKNIKEIKVLNFINIHDCLIKSFHIWELIMVNNANDYLNY